MTMQRLRIGLLNAAYDDADARRNFRREVDADLVEFHGPSGEVPTTYDFDGAIITGSKASVYWDEEWIDLLKSWVDEAIERDMPMLGICWGHQLLADVLGGEVESMDEYELGYRTVQHSGDSMLFDGIDEEFTVFTTHSDRVANLPPDATLIAENDYGIHGFEQGHVFAVQFHPEYDQETAVTVTKGKETVDQETIDRVLAGITDEQYQAACEAKLVFENFTRYVRGLVTEESRNVAGVTEN
jgi:GMP synthase (glutamine-hydrolysing)